MAAITVAVLVPQARRHWNWRSGVVALAYAVCLTSFVVATKNTTAANAIFLQGTAPIYLLFLGPWILKEPVRRADWVTVLFVGIGMGMVFWEEGAAQKLAPNPTFGNWCGALSGFAWAATVCGLRWLSKGGQGDSMAPVLMGNCISVLLCLPQLMSMQALAMKDLAPILYLGIFQVGLAYWCLTQAMVKLSALEASLLILIEPALNPLWTWIMHGEKPTMTAMGGGAMIIGSALLKSWHDRKNVVN